MLGGGPAHLAGIGVGGMVAQVAALDHPGAFSALTLVGTRAVAPGPPDDDLPDHDQATMSRLFAQPMPDWTDREAVAEFAAAGAEILGDDRLARARSPPASGTARPAPHPGPDGQPDGHGVLQAQLEPRWRERLPKIEVPTLVVHGRRDPFFPVGNGEAIARRDTGARLLVLDEAADCDPRCGGRRGRRKPVLRAPVGTDARLLRLVLDGQAATGGRGQVGPRPGTALSGDARC